MVISPGRLGLRGANREQILRTILREGPLARVNLAQHVGLTTAAITNITRDLIGDGLLYEVGTARGGRVGANAILLDVPEEKLVLGVVHQGVSALRVALCTLRGRVLARKSIATSGPYAPEWAIATIVQTLKHLLSTNGYTESSLVGVGAGLVGLIDAPQGIVKRAPRLGWENIVFKSMLEQQCGCPVAIENNVRAMALGEALLGAGRGWSDFAFVYIGTGIGSGLIIDGRPYRGAYGGAGELGHITVDPMGTLCSCGNYGCLETIAAEPALVEQIHLHSLDALICEGSSAECRGNTKDMVQSLAHLAINGNADAQEIVAYCGEYAGIALANLVNVLNPNRIVLHGAITEAGELFFAPVAQSLRKRAFFSETVDIVAPTFGADAGIVGAAAVALDALILTQRA
ncbi:MAG TPA: hypothetical protein DHW02_19915 [Ktedonobacter sp.]|nr:hypothetical protein [Ktedonobacter sp.]